MAAPTNTTFQAGKLRSQSTKDLLDGPAARELILLAGKDGTGKTCALVSFASYVEMIQNPAAQFFVIDLENKFKSALRSFGRDAPDNLVYYQVNDINEATEAVDLVLAQYRPGDWLAVDSAARLWDKAQDLGYQVIAGVAKMTYMEKRREFAKANPGAKAPPVTPKPDDLWSVVKGAHDGAFWDELIKLNDLNVVATTAIKKPPKEQANRQESADRKELRAEFGVDANFEGAPRLPYNVETTLMLSAIRGKGHVRVLRDNLSVLEEPRIEFDVASRKDWAADFYTNCR